jgi:hypothetical protein
VLEGDLEVAWVSGVMFVLLNILYYRICRWVIGRKIERNSPRKTKRGGAGREVGATKQVCE